MADVVLVHGTTQSASGWDPLRGRLVELGHRVVAVELPTDRPQASAQEYADLAAAQAGGTSRPIVVGHSGAGALLPALGDRLDARHLVWLAALVPDFPGGTSPAEELSQRAEEMFNPEWLTLSAPDPVAASYFLFHDCGFDTLRWALSTLRLFDPVGVYAEPPQRPRAPSTFVLPRHDRTLTPAWMRRAAHERLHVTPVEIDGGHAPHVSRPDRLARILDEVIDGK